MTEDNARELMRQADDRLENGRVPEALSLYERVCLLDPNNSEAWMMRGALLGESGQVQPAIEYLQRAVTLDPENTEAHEILGRLLAATGRPAEAARQLEAALDAEPDNAELWSLLTALHGQMKDFPAAAEAGRKAVALQPGSIDAHMNLANALRETDDLESAIRHYRTATQLAPALVEAWKGWAAACSELGHSEDALLGFRRVLALQPDDLQAINGEAGVLAQMGEFDAALARIEPLLLAGKADTETALLYAALSRQHGEHARAIACLEQWLGDPSLSPALRARVHFALGKLRDSVRDYDQAFTHFEQANRLRHDPAMKLDEHRRLVDALKSTYSPSFVQTMPRSSCMDDRPLFIVGMPRSGTSLVEQILASHPEVYGAGERWDVACTALALPETLSHPEHYPFCIPALDADTATRLAQSYLSRLEESGGTARRFTDKMPHNFTHLGLIAQLFPKARVIHCMRDPLDTCLSCYFSDFHRKHEYSNDLETLGAYYQLYLELMAHWARVLPDNLPVLDIQYEELVADPETVSRKIIAFSGLDWDARCLDFHKTRRTVVTLSYEQVRQPVYSSSVGRWKHYDKHLGPLKKAFS